nr:hypothetical protein [uncultured Flavobacterium sp.]
MKKLIAALTLMLAFSINANAQDKKELTATEKGKKEAAELTQFLGLSATQNDDFYRLFEQKHRILEDTTLSAERKIEVSKVIEAKIRATLDGAQMEKLEKNPDLLKKLIN